MSINRTSALFNTVRKNTNVLRRDVQPHEANRLQRSGPNNLAIVGIIAALGGAYIFYESRQVDKVKEDIATQSLKEPKKNVAGGGGAEIKR
ncbi:hypothetical protein J3Q64DRAFT_1841930 [Phycomyces blakesleeanus]|uniref:Uncharacterized protein n=1 Tax=Phycomyces blakesleeanus TaxID=4837 RepID=A0ABR3AII6_PHYBL